MYHDSIREDLCSNGNGWRLDTMFDVIYAITYSEICWYDGQSRITAFAMLKIWDVLNGDSRLYLAEGPLFSDLVVSLAVAVLHRNVCICG